MWKYDGIFWTCIFLDDSSFIVGNYGIKGVTSPLNIPGARSGAASWVDPQDTLWMFGGYGYSTDSSKIGYLNDLWKFNGTEWTWISGSNETNAIGVYSGKGVVAVANIPSGRSFSSALFSSKLNVTYVFGGCYYNIDNYQQYLFNDFWVLDTSKEIYTPNNTTSNGFLLTSSSSDKINFAAGIGIGVAATIVLIVSSVIIFVLRTRNQANTEPAFAKTSELSVVPQLHDIEIKQRLGGGNFGEGSDKITLN